MTEFNVCYAYVCKYVYDDEDDDFLNSNLNIYEDQRNPYKNKVLQCINICICTNVKIPLF